MPIDITNTTTGKDLVEEFEKISKTPQHEMRLTYGYKEILKNE